MSRRIWLMSCAFLACASATHAQQNHVITALSGTWYSFEPSRGLSGACAIQLYAEPASPPEFKAETKECRPPLDQVNGWRFSDGMIRLTASGVEIAALGGHQLRMSGEDSAGTPLVLDRPEGDQNARAIKSAIGAYRCLFLGYTDQCAAPTDTRFPPVSDVARITTLVALNLRSQPRADASVIAQLPPGTVASTDLCLVTADGPWCRVQLGEVSGWLARTALRQGEWPILTYRITPASPDGGHPKG